MGVMLDPRHDPMPTEEELARAAGLTAGDCDPKLFELRAVDILRDEPRQASEFFLGGHRVVPRVEHHSHSSAPFFQA